MQGVPAEPEHPHQSVSDSHALYGDGRTGLLLEAAAAGDICCPDIDDLFFFAERGKLHGEYNALYESMFKNPDRFGILESRS